MLTSLLLVLAALAAAFGVATGALAAFRPGWGHPVAAALEGTATRVADSRTSDVPDLARRAVASGIAKFLDASVFDIERSRFLSPGVAIVVGFLFPVAATVNAVLGGSPMLMTAFLIATLSIAALAVADTLTGPRAWSAIPAGLAVLLWGGVLPLYALWSLTSHFMGGPLYRSVIAGIILGCCLFAVLAVIWTVLRRGRSGHAVTGFEARIAHLIVGLPLFFVGYWLMLALAAATGAEDLARGWPALTACMIAGGMALAVAAPMFKAADTRSSLPKALAAMIGSGLCAAVAGFSVAWIVQDAPSAEWLGILPVLVWSVVPLILCGFLVLKSLRAIMPTRPLQAMAASALTVSGALVAAAYFAA